MISKKKAKELSSAINSYALAMADQAVDEKALGEAYWSSQQYYAVQLRLIDAVQKLKACGVPVVGWFETDEWLAKRKQYVTAAWCALEDAKAEEA